MQSSFRGIGLSKYNCQYRGLFSPLVSGLYCDEIYEFLYRVDCISINASDVDGSYLTPAVVFLPTTSTVIFGYFFSKAALNCPDKSLGKDANLY